MGVNLNGFGANFLRGGRGYKSSANLAQSFQAVRAGDKCKGRDMSCALKARKIQRRKQKEAGLKIAPSSFLAAFAFNLTRTKRSRLNLTHANISAFKFSSQSALAFKILLARRALAFAKSKRINFKISRRQVLNLACTIAATGQVQTPWPQ